MTVNHLAEVVLKESGSDSEIIHKPYTSAFPNKVDVKHRVPNLSRITGMLGEIQWPRIEEVVSNMVKKSKANLEEPAHNLQQTLVS